MYKEKDDGMITHPVIPKNNQTTNLMKTYYEKHSLEYNAKLRCFF